MEVITTHINADFDSLASMLAAKKLYPDAVLVFPGSTEKNLRDFFIQSTFYVFQTERIKNIDLAAIRRLILVDTRQPGRIGKFSEVAGRPEVELHIYDHHPPSPEDLRGRVEVIRETGATITILAAILRERSVPLTSEEATVMAVGLYEDTGSFTFSSTTPEDLETAAFLLSKGANLNIVSSLITRELTADQISLLNELIQTATRHTVQGLEVVVAKASSDKYVGDFAFLVHKLKDMENINVLFALAQMEDRVYLVARSRIEEVNVGEIAAAFGGGGHATAAAATIREMNLGQAEKKLLDFLEKRIHPIRFARELMSFPVKTVPALETIEHAGELLTRYNINVLPVTENGRLAGLISRQIIEKAAFHGFKDSPVRDYMSTEFATVSPTTPLPKVQDLIVGNNQRFLPVLEKTKLVGAITRTDLLRWLYTRSDQLAGPMAEPDFFSAKEPRRRGIGKIMEERLPDGVLSLLKRHRGEGPGPGPAGLRRRRVRARPAPADGKFRHRHGGGRGRHPPGPGAGRGDERGSESTQKIRDRDGDGSRGIPAGPGDGPAGILRIPGRLAPRGAQLHQARPLPEGLYRQRPGHPREPAAFRGTHRLSSGGRRT